MRLQQLAMTVMVVGSLVFLGGCGGTDSTASAAPEAASSVQTGNAAIASLVETGDPATDDTAAEASAAAEPIQLAAASTDRSGTPRIVVDDPIFDFGSMEVGEQREHSWVIRNEGTADLHITSVRPSCGCTNTAMADDIIPPGGSSTLSSVLDLPRQVGAVRKNIAIHSNDPQQGTVVVAFVGTATQAIVLDPQVLAFQNVEREAELTMTASLKAYEEGLTFNITEVSTGTDENFDASYETIEEGRHYEIIVKTRPPLHNDYLRDRVYIHTDHPTLNLIQLTVVANVLTDIISAPDVIRLNADHTDPIKRMILLRAGRVTDFTVTGVDLPDPAMSYEVTVRQQGMVYVEVDNIVAKPELEGTHIIVYTDAESVPEVRIPISVVGTGDRTLPSITSGASEADTSG